MHSKTRVQLDDRNRPKKFICQACGNVYNAKDTLRRHIKDIHTEHSTGDLHSTFCNKCTFKNARVKKEHERYCSKNPKYKKSQLLLL